MSSGKAAACCSSSSVSGAASNDAPKMVMKSMTARASYSAVLAASVRTPGCMQAYSEDKAHAQHGNEQGYG